MRRMGSIDAKTLTMGLIAWMRREGVAPTRTRLVKFLYLADLQHARYKGGRTLTGWRWRTKSFGPFASEARQLFDEGVRAGWLLQSGATEEDEDDDEGRAVFYDVAHADVTLLEPLPLLGKVREWIKQYGDSTSNLLRFVYGHTEPMEVAKDGEDLDFTRARPPGPGPAVRSQPLSRKQEKRLDELMRNLRSEYEAARLASRTYADGPRDRAYFDGLPKETEPPTDEFVLRFPP